MPIYMNIDQIDRMVVMVAHGSITYDDAHFITAKLIDADALESSRIIDLSAATSSLTDDEINAIALMLRKAPGYERRGPIAYVVIPERVRLVEGFMQASRADRPVNLFWSLHGARQWLAQQAAPAKPLDHNLSERRHGDPVLVAAPLQRLHTIAGGQVSSGR